MFKRAKRSFYWLAKEVNQYEVNAEQRASSGLDYTSYKESSHVSIYRQYQNKIATAKESYNIAVKTMIIRMQKLDLKIIVNLLKFLIIHYNKG